MKMKVSQSVFQLLIAPLVLLTMNLNAQNFGFEFTPGSAPPNQWTFVTGTWNTETNISLIRTGKQCMHINTMSGSGTTLYNTSAYVPVTNAGGYLITMAWTKSDILNATLYLGYRGATTVLNPSVLTTGQPINVSDVSWNRIISISAATIAPGNYGPSMRAYRSNASITTNLYIDDVILYWSPVPVADTIAPSPVSNVLLSQSGGNPSLSWTNGTDNLSGMGGVVILRANGVQTSLPTLNDQAMYNPVPGALGTDTVHSGGVAWYVAGSITDSTIASFVDASAVSGNTYTYAIYQRDVAHNYAAGVSPVACISAPPSSVAQASVSTICSGQDFQLFLNTSFTNYTYQWQSSPDGVSYSDIAGAVSDTITVNLSAPTYYRCVVTCFSVGSTNSSPIQVSMSPNPQAGPMQAVQTSGFNFNFSLPNAQNVDFYLWDFGNGSTSSSAAPSYQYPQGGTYTVKVSVFNACGEDSSSFEIIGLDLPIESKPDVIVYPNPAKDQFSIEGLNAGDQVEMFGILGNKVLVITAESSEILTVSRQGISNGIYILKVFRKGSSVDSMTIELTD
jgi:PKD repeat protein